MNLLKLHSSEKIKTQAAARAYTDRVLKAINPKNAKMVFIDKCEADVHKLNVWIGNIFSPIIGWYYDIHNTEFCNSKIRRAIIENAVKP